MIAIGFVIAEFLGREQSADLRFTDLAPVQKDVGGDAFVEVILHGIAYGGRRFAHPESRRNHDDFTRGSGRGGIRQGCGAGFDGDFIGNLGWISS